MSSDDRKVFFGGAFGLKLIFPECTGLSRVLIRVYRVVISAGFCRAL